MNSVELERTIRDFLKVAELAGHRLSYEDYIIDYREAPHIPPVLVAGR